MAGGDNDFDLDAILGELSELENQISSASNELSTSLGETTEKPASTTDPATSTSNASALTWDAAGIDSQLQDALSELSGFITGDFNVSDSSTNQDESKDSIPNEPTQNEPMPNRQPPSGPTPSGNTPSGPTPSGPSQSGTTPSSGRNVPTPDSLPTKRKGSTKVPPPIAPRKHVEPQSPSTISKADSSPSSVGGDSAFLELPSSASHISVNTSVSQTSGASSGIGSLPSPTPLSNEQKAKIKEEKLRLAMEKMEQSNLQKLLVRAYSADGSAKSLFVGENMTVADITAVLAVKNHARLTLDSAIVEIIPELSMERVFEDHDTLVENLLFWTKDSNNKVLYVERPEKYHFFTHPELYLPVDDGKSPQHVTNENRKNMIKNFYESIEAVPKVEGVLHVKSEGKKSWKKHWFELRSSGIYYNPKSKLKPTDDMARFQALDVVDVYLSIGWKKKYKSPTEYGFALKHPQIQKKASKYIKYLCAEDEKTWRQWISGIRVVKHGKTLLESYNSAKESVELWDYQDFTSDPSKPAPASVAPNGVPPVLKAKPACKPNPPKVNSATEPSQAGKGPVRFTEPQLKEKDINANQKPPYEEAESNFIAANQSGTAYIPVSTSTLKYIGEQQGTVSRSPKNKAKQQQKQDTSELPPPPPDPVLDLPSPGGDFPPPPTPNTLEENLRNGESQSVEHIENKPEQAGTFFAVVQDSPAKTVQDPKSGTFFAVVAGDSDGRGGAPVKVPPPPPQRNIIRTPVIPQTPPPPAHIMSDRDLPPPPPPQSQPPPPQPPPPRAPGPPRTPGQPRPPPPVPQRGLPMLPGGKIAVLPGIPLRGARPKVKPAPPKRHAGTRLSTLQKGNPAFMNHINQVLECKQHHSQSLKQDPRRPWAPGQQMPDHLDYLPPPPPELLAGLPQHQPKQPPLPPRRNNETRLSQHQ